jgi:YegS/Rv2252/BmrU family lipid kinase
MKAAIIINPFSGKRRATRVRRQAERVAANLGVALSVKTIKGPGHGVELTREALSDGAERVLCAGGDGSLNAVATGLLGTTVPLGVVPMGSGNGYSRSLGLPQQTEEALRVAFTGKLQRMDVGFLNDQPFLSTAGIGFDARVADRFERAKRRGMIGYLRIILKAIASAETLHVQVTANGQATEADLLMLVFCNCREFGNGVRISPASRPDDGVAELQLVSKPPLRSLPLAFLNLYTHRADRLRYIRSISTTEALVAQDGTIAHLDGEPVAIGHRVRFRLAPRQLLVVIDEPKPAACRPDKTHAFGR